MTGTSLLGVDINPEISTCNLSDAMGRTGSLGSFKLISPPASTVYGRAVTCETPVGDWKAVVQAIDTLTEGDILVAKSNGGYGKAIMGELLAHSAKIRGAVAAVIDGSVRDVAELGNLDMPIYAKEFVPNAGDPEGNGKVGLTVTVNGVEIGPGDVIACDHSGLIRIPEAKFKEVVSRAEGIVEKEHKVREQVLEGKMLSDILGF